MSAINSNSFFVTLSPFNNFTAEYDLNTLQIRNANYMVVYATQNCQFTCPLLPTSYVFDEEATSLVEFQVGTTCGFAGVIYEIPNFHINKGSITLYEQSLVEQNPVSILFYFYKEKPKCIDKLDTDTYVNIRLGASQQSVTKTLSLENYIRGFKYFEFYSTYDGCFDVSFAAPKSISFGTTLLQGSRICGSNTNKLELNKCVDLIDKIEIKRVPLLETAYDIDMFFIFYKEFPKKYAETDPEQQSNQLLLVRPTAYGEFLVNFNSIINSYYSIFNKRDAYFYYNNCRLYLSKLGNDFFDFITNWQSINKVYIKLYFVSKTPSEGNFQFFYTTQSYPGFSMMYIPFNFKSMGTVFTQNCGFTKSAKGSYEKLFSIGGRVVSTINLSVNPDAYSNVQPSRLLYNGVYYPAKFDVDTTPIFLADSAIPIYILGGNFDQLILYTTPDNDLSYRAVNNNNSPLALIYKREDIVANIPNGSIFTITDLPVYTSQLINNDNYTLAIAIFNFANVRTSTVQNQVPIYNVFTSTSPIIGNSTLYRNITTNGIYAQRIIRPRDLEIGNVIFNGATTAPTIDLNDRSGRFILINRPFAFDPISRGKFNFNFDFSKPSEIIYYDNVTNVWTSFTSIGTNEAFSSDFLYFKFNNIIDWVYTTVPTNSYNFYLSSTPKNTQIFEENYCPTVWDNNLVRAYINSDTTNAGCINIQTVNNTLLKMQSFDIIRGKNIINPSQPSLTYPKNALDTVKQADLGNFDLAAKWNADMMRTSNPQVSAQAVDDEPFSEGLRIFPEYFNYNEYNSLFFVSKNSVTIRLYYDNSAWTYDSNLSLYKYNFTFKLPDTFAKYTWFTSQAFNMQAKQNTQRAFIIYTDLGLKYRGEFKASCIINNLNQFSIQNKINSLQNFTFFLNDLPVDNIPAPYNNLYHFSVVLNLQ